MPLTLPVQPPVEWIETVQVAIYEQGLEDWGPQVRGVHDYPNCWSRPGVEGC